MVAVAFAQPTQSLARADSGAGEKKRPQLVRRHSSGDHAFLPNRQETSAKLLAARGGVQKGDMPDSEVRAPPMTTTSGPLSTPCERRSATNVGWTACSFHRSPRADPVPHVVAGSPPSHDPRLLKRYGLRRSMTLSRVGASDGCEWHSDACIDLGGSICVSRRGGALLADLYCVVGGACRCVLALYFCIFWLMVRLIHGETAHTPERAIERGDLAI